MTDVLTRRGEDRHMQGELHEDGGRHWWGDLQGKKGRQYQRLREGMGQMLP